MSKTQITMADIIDRLFSRLSATYGADWTRQWKDIPIADVKTAWSHELAGYINHMGAIAYALDNLPDRCPNVIQFRNICRAAPARDVPRIEAPKANPEIIAHVLSKLAEPMPKIDGREWARRKLAAHDAGDRVGIFGLNLARQALGVTA